MQLYQDHDPVRPILSDTRQITVDVQTGDVILDRQPSFMFEGSQTTRIKIILSGRRVTMEDGKRVFTFYCWCCDYGNTSND